MGFVAHVPGVQVYIVADQDHGLVPRQEVDIAETVVIVRERDLGAEAAVDVALKDQEAGQEEDEDTIIQALQEVVVVATITNQLWKFSHI